MYSFLQSGVSDHSCCDSASKKKSLTEELSVFTMKKEVSNGGAASGGVGEIGTRHWENHSNQPKERENGSRQGGWVLKHCKQENGIFPIRIGTLRCCKVRIYLSAV